MNIVIFISLQRNMKLNNAKLKNCYEMRMDRQREATEKREQDLETE